MGNPPSNTPDPGETRAKEVTRHATRAENGRRVITLEEKDKESGTHLYLDVEPFGDPDLYDSYTVKRVPDNPDVMDVNVNGMWVRTSVEKGPLVVHDHVE